MYGTEKLSKFEIQLKLTKRNVICKIQEEVSDFRSRRR